MKYGVEYASMSLVTTPRYAFWYYYIRQALINRAYLKEGPLLPLK